MSKVEIINALIAELEDSGQSAGEIKDRYHSFRELYDFRMVYNAALFNEWCVAGLYNVHKSIKHYDGEDCFGGGWFVVVAMLPTGQITNHYKVEYWELFKIPTEERALYPYDGHTPQDVLKRLKEII